MDAAYGNLLRSNSVFWATSGLGIDAGLTGFTLKAESLTTIARGGVSFITPSDDSASRIRPGHVFALHAAEDAEWTKEASTVSLIDFPLPPTVVLRSTWKEKMLGFTRTRERDMSALLVNDSDQQLRLLAPTSGMQAPDTALADTWNMALFAPGVEGPLIELGNQLDYSPRANGIEEYVLPAGLPRGHSIAFDTVRAIAEPEDCCLVRSVATAKGPSSVIHSLSRVDLSASGNTWQVDARGADLDDWHGAAVVGTTDGSVIGMFLDAHRTCHRAFGKPAGA